MSLESKLQEGSFNRLTGKIRRGLVYAITPLIMGTSVSCNNGNGIIIPPPPEDSNGEVEPPDEPQERNYDEAKDLFKFLPANWGDTWIYEVTRPRYTLLRTATVVGFERDRETEDVVRWSKEWYGGYSPPFVLGGGYYTETYEFDHNTRTIALFSENFHEGNLAPMVYTYDPPVVIGDNSLAKGKTYTTRSNLSEDGEPLLEITRDYTYEHLEDVVVPAGTFKDCWRVIAPSPSSKVIWLAPGIGEIKRVDTYYGEVYNLIAAQIGDTFYPSIEKFEELLSQ
jgi:hypothetical protein